MEIGTFFIYVGCFIGILIIGRIFIVPLKFIVRVLINSAIGIALLYAINWIAVVGGLHIGINLSTAIVTGLLGIPGVFLIIILKLFL